MPRYVVAIGSQAAIDRCNLVLWWRRPLWLAGHDYCGYRWLATVPTGRDVVVRSGPARGTYVVTGHRRLPTGSAMPRVSADLVLQSCLAHRMIGLTLLRRSA